MAGTVLAYSSSSRQSQIAGESPPPLSIICPAVSPNGNNTLYESLLAEDNSEEDHLPSPELESRPADRHDTPPTVKKPRGRPKKASEVTTCLVPDKQPTLNTVWKGIKRSRGLDDSPHDLVSTKKAHTLDLTPDHGATSPVPSSAVLNHNMDKAWSTNFSVYSVRLSEHVQGSWALTHGANQSDASRDRRANPSDRSASGRRAQLFGTNTRGCHMQTFEFRTRKLENSRIGVPILGSATVTVKSVNNKSLNLQGELKLVTWSGLQSLKISKIIACHTFFILQIMDADLLVVVVAWMMMYVIVRRRRRNIRWRNRRWWVRPVNQNRRTQGDFGNLFQELKNDEVMFHRYTRMDVPTFNDLLNLVRPHQEKYHPRALSAEQRLSLTLRYLASGDQPLSIALAYRIGESTCRIIIKEVTEVLGRVLAPIYLRQPTENAWRDIAFSFLEQWNMPNCVGAIDGKHVHVQAPPHSGSWYFNYKKTFSMVLLAVCDANYKFTLIHSGEMGSNSDAGIFADCPLGQLLREEQLGLPVYDAQLPGSNISTPHFFVGDAAFPLSTRMMKPFPGHGLNDQKKVFNYRLSRARGVIENAFGILSSRWRIFRKPITLHPESVDSIILAAVCLHNFLKTRDEADEPARRAYVPPNFVDWEDEEGVLHPGLWREQGGLENMLLPPPQFPFQNAVNMRHTLAEYFMTPEGEVPWQMDYIRRVGQAPDV